MKTDTPSGHWMAVTHKVDVYLDDKLEEVQEARVNHPGLTMGPYLLTDIRENEVLLDGYLAVPKHWVIGL